MAEEHNPKPGSGARRTGALGTVQSIDLDESGEFVLDLGDPVDMADQAPVRRADPLELFAFEVSDQAITSASDLEALDPDSIDDLDNPLQGLLDDDHESVDLEFDDPPPRSTEDLEIPSPVRSPRLGGAQRPPAPPRPTGVARYAGLAPPPPEHRRPRRSFDMDEPAIPGAARPESPRSRSITRPKSSSADEAVPDDPTQMEDLSMAFASRDPLAFGRELTDNDVSDVQVQDAFDPWADMDDEDEISLSESPSWSGHSEPESLRASDFSAPVPNGYALGFEAPSARPVDNRGRTGREENSTPFADLRKMGLMDDGGGGGLSTDFDDIFGAAFDDHDDVLDELEEIGPIPGLNETIPVHAQINDSPTRPPVLSTSLAGGSREAGTSHLPTPPRRSSRAQAEGVPTVELERPVVRSQPEEATPAAFLFSEHKEQTRPRSPLPEDQPTPQPPPAAAQAPSPPTDEFDIETFLGGPLGRDSDAFELASRRAEELSSREVESRQVPPAPRPRVEAERPRFGTQSHVPEPTEEVMAPREIRPPGAGITRSRRGRSSAPVEPVAPRVVAPATPVARPQPQPTIATTATINDLITLAGSLDRIPRVLLSPSQLTRLSLDSRGGFLLSQIDGTMSYDELVELGLLPRDQAITILCHLLLEGAIG